MQVPEGKRYLYIRGRIETEGHGSTRFLGKPKDLEEWDFDEKIRSTKRQSPQRYFNNSRG